MPTATILLIDDSPKTALALSQVLAGSGRVTSCRLAQLGNQQVVHRIDAELEFDPGQGDALRQVIVRFSPGADVIVLTGNELIEFDMLQRETVMAVRSIRNPASLDATQRVS